jgi:predicted enzyme related to lactoylglutathione lyase
MIHEPLTMRAESVTIATKDPEKLSEFYRNAFHFPEGKWQNKDHIGFQLENIYLGFDRTKEKIQNGEGGLILWFTVRDVEHAFQQLISAGAEVRTNVTREERPGKALAVLIDPDGNKIGLIGPSVRGQAI